MSAPSGIYPGEFSWWRKDTRDLRYKATGEFRPPKKGEFYLSGAIITAYRAPNDLGTAHWIAVPGKIQTVTTVTWTPDALPVCTCTECPTCGAPMICATCNHCVSCYRHTPGCLGCPASYGNLPPIDHLVKPVNAEAIPGDPINWRD
jgi:hypothetical protein